MPAGHHLFRRGAVYYWRRRLTTGKFRTTIFQVSLRSQDRRLASRLGAELTVVSDILAPALGSARLSPAAFRNIIARVARLEADRLERSAMLDRASAAPSPLSGERGERLRGAAWRLLAERGRAASVPADPAFLAACGLAHTDAPEVQAVLDKIRGGGDNGVPATDSLGRLLREYAPDGPDSPIALAEAEHAYFRGMAAACLHTSPRWGSTLESDIATAFAQEAPPRVVTLPGTSAPVPTDQLAMAASRAPDAGEPPPERAGLTMTGLALKLAAERNIDGSWTAKTGRQVEQTTSLLARAVGHDRIDRLSQADMAQYVDVLRRLPKNYGKSRHDATCSLREILNRGERLPASERGLSGATINRHLTQIGELLSYAASQGIEPAHPVSLTRLRARKKTRSRDERAAFEKEDLAAIFQQPVWTGCRDERRRWTLGSEVFHDGLYWAPLIAHYALMRREEICGLMIADVVLDTDVPYLDVRPNGYRQLKTAQSTRRVPVHPELLRLGFAEYVQAIRNLEYDLLFPDLLPATPDAGPLGDQLHDDWTRALRAAVPDATEAKKSFHSFRHSGNNALTEAEIMLEWRQDLLGHGGESEAEERYRSDVRLPLKLKALLRLPDVTSHLPRRPIRLREMVRTKRGRKRRNTQNTPASGGLDRDVRDSNISGRLIRRGGPSASDRSGARKHAYRGRHASKGRGSSWREQSQTSS